LLTGTLSLSPAEQSLTSIATAETNATPPPGTFRQDARRTDTGEIARKPVNSPGVGSDSEVGDPLRVPWACRPTNAFWEQRTMPLVERLDRYVRHGEELVSVTPEDYVATAARRMNENGISSLVVLDEAERMVGILSEKDIVSKVVVTDRDPEEVQVCEIMTPDVVTCERVAPIQRAAEIMAERGIRHLPISDRGKIVGMVSSRDIIAFQISAHQKQA
jgi:CBS domain-containing protein